MKSPFSILVTLSVCLIFSGCTVPTEKSALRENDSSHGTAASSSQDAVTPPEQTDASQPGTPAPLLEAATPPDKPIKDNIKKEIVKKDIADKATLTENNTQGPAASKPRILLSGTTAELAKRQPAERKAAAPAAYARLSSGLVQPAPDDWRLPNEEVNRENYDHFNNNPVLRVAENPVSTFSIDVDTGSYTNVRRMLHQGRLPVKDAVRVEEFINYFNYEYPTPKSPEHPFNVVTEIGPNPWNTDTVLLHIGIKAYDVDREQLPPSNLVFLVDVSGSMQSPDKLPLLINSLKLLVNKMRAQDKLSLVVYAGASGVVLEPTSGQNKGKITAALESLSAGGSTNGAAGIRLAYAKAREAFIKNGINRVILATDGDFNVGTVNFEALKNLVEEQRRSGVSLTTLGFGSGNFNDHLMEQLADVGNGNYAYIDTLNEAQKVLVNEMGSTLQTVAKDVKIQLEFNPAVVAEYRLIGYENRALRREDFNNDKIDAGEIGAGHTVTALYEIALAGKDGKGQTMDELRYGQKSETSRGFSNELALLRLRYKKPTEDQSQLMETPLLKSQLIGQLAQTSSRYRFAASVAAFGQILRGGQFTQNFGLDEVMALARQSRGDDPWGYRGEFINLVNLAKSLGRS